MSDFDKELADSISAATVKRKQDAQADQAAAAERREQDRERAERLVAAKNLAHGFRHKHLEPMLLAAQKKAREADPQLCLMGDYDNDDDSGVVSQLIRAGEATLSASVRYTGDNLRIAVAVTTPNQPSCYREARDFAAQPFDEAAAVEWIQPLIAEAIAALIGSGDVPTDNIIRYGNYNT